MFQKLYEVSFLFSSLFFFLITFLLIYLALCRVGVLGLTLTALVGLAQLNFEGPGVSASIKALWKAPKPKEA